MKPNKDIEYSGKVTSQTLQLLATRVKPGVTPLDLEKMAVQTIKKLRAEPAFTGYQGYPFATCISVNNTIVHGIPTDKPLKPGDIVGIDVGAKYHGWYSDSAITIAIPPQTEANLTLIDATKQALKEGIKAAKAGNKVGDISHAVEKVADQHKLGVIKQLTGHGIGLSIHQSPSVPNFGQPNKGEKLQNGQYIAIEPMFALFPDSHSDNLSSVETDSDGWSIKLKKNNIGVHFEHTIMINDDAPIILTTPVDTTGYIW